MDAIKHELSEYKALLQELLNKMSLQQENKKPQIPPNFVGLNKNTPEGEKSSIGNEGVYAFTHSLIHSPFTHLSTYSNKHSRNPSQNTLTSPISNNYPNKNNQLIQNELKNKELTLTFQKNEQDINQNNQLVTKNEQDYNSRTLTFPNFPTLNTINTHPNEDVHPLQTLTNKEFLVFLTIYRLEKEIPRVTYAILSKYLSLTSGCIRSYVTSLIRKRVPLTKSKLNNKITILSIESSFKSITSEQKLINLYYQGDPSQSTLI